MTDPSPARISSYEYILESSDIAGVNDYGVITAAAPGETTVRIRTFSPGEDSPESVVCETEVTVIVEEEVPEEIIYTAVNDNVQWKKGSSEGITITVKRSPEDETCFSHFESFRIDDAVLVKDKDYTAAKGSTVIAVSLSALSSLSAGDHSFTVLFDDGRASGKLTVTEEKKTEYRIPSLF